MTNRKDTLTALLLSLCFAGCVAGAEPRAEPVEVSLGSDGVDGLVASSMEGHLARPHCATGPGLAWWVTRDGAVLDEHYQGVEDPAFDDEIGPSSTIPRDALPATLRPVSPRGAVRPDPEPSVALEEVGALLQERSHRSADDAAVATASTAAGTVTRSLLVHVPGTDITIFAVTTSRDLDLFRVVDEIQEFHRHS